MPGWAGADAAPAFDGPGSAGWYISCPPELPGGANNLDAKLDDYANISRKVAKELNLNLCDLRKAFVDHLQANNTKKAASGILTSDRVHLNEAGNRLVAQAILKTLGE